ncbi:MAG: histidine kinase [Opitutaceae bacterium]
MERTTPTAKRSAFDVDLYFYVMGLSTLIGLPLMVGGRYLAGTSASALFVILIVSLVVNFLMVAVGILLFQPIIALRNQARKFRQIVALVVYSTLIISIVSAQFIFFRDKRPNIQNPWLTWISLVGIRGTFISGVILFYFNKLHHKQLTEIEHRQMEVEMLARTAEIGQLKAQINPHFLFNTLTAISARSTQPDVDLMVEGLAEVLRYNLAQTFPKDIFAKEVHAIKSYLSILELRFGDKINIEIDITDAAAAALVPQPLLLPLVENAIKYGQQTASTPLLIRVGAKLTEKGFIASVENTGTWREPKAVPQPGQQIGLSNLRRRLELIYGTEASVTHESLADTVRVNVLLPLAGG